MVDIQHSALTGANLHEVKGADSATTGQVPVSNGAGAAPFAILTADKVNIADAGGFFTGATVEAALQEVGPVETYLNGVIADISTVSFAMVALPFDGVVQSFQTLLGGVITTGDAVVTVTRGSDAAILGTVTVANSGSAEGDQDENASLSNNTLTKATHKYLKIATDGGSTNTVPLYFQIKITKA